ncbi:MAG TPA: cation:proton antiporter [Gemmatimonadales bacterium]|jgi:NhaP-type Na+/H+ or K+/H+ antiporter|nr:cation:proton antiporter [Gemmatimonadales bacterium]
MDTATFALVGGVILVAALLSGLVERSRFPQVALFLLLGLAIGPFGFGLVDFRLDSAILETISVLALVLVLFTDAVAIDVGEVRRHRTLVRLVLGPGTLVTAALIAVAAWALLGLAPGPAAILGAALASTDPVMMRGLLRGGTVPADARNVLSLESGLNDLVLLPIVLAAMAVLSGGGGGGHWGRAALDLFVVGPGAGIAVGFIGVTVLERARRWVGVRRDYESLYALGIAFTAYAAAEAAHGSGFLAAFAAGLTVAAADAELCDCFLDFGQAAAEMFLLLTFVAFGSSLIWTGLAGLTWRGVAFAVLALGVRSAVLAVALIGRGLDPRSRRLIVWFGPRGLSTLLLVLLPVFAGLPGADRLFAPAALVVLLSVVIHGGALMFTRERRAGSGIGPSLDPTPPARSPERITLGELRDLQARGERVVLLDVRKDRAWNESNEKALGAIRLPPGGAAPRAAELALPRHDWLVAYCA